MFIAETFRLFQNVFAYDALNVTSASHSVLALARLTRFDDRFESPLSFDQESFARRKLLLPRGDTFEVNLMPLSSGICR
jgi:hypothetical protein